MLMSILQQEEKVTQCKTMQIFFFLPNFSFQWRGPLLCDRFQLSHQT